MKTKLYIVCLLSFLLSGCMKQDLIPENDDSRTETITPTQQKDDGLFYYYFGEKIYLEQRTDMVFLEFTPGTPKGQFQAITNSNVSLQAKKSSRETRSTEDSSFNTIILESTGGKEISPTVLKSFKSKAEIVSATYLLEYNKCLSAITNEFSVKLKETASYDQLRKLSTENDCIINEHEWFDKDEFLISVPKSSDLDAIQMSNLFYETGLFKFTAPNFVRLNAFSSNDTYYADQWGLKNTGQYGSSTGFDINVESAWTITKGSPNIKVAVLDYGVDLTHPDLQANLLQGFDASGGNTGGAPSSASDNHGTAVAGIIGAIKDNGKGISGVAPGCKIVPVKVNTGLYIYDTSAIAGFNWAKSNGADVINCSWGGGQPNAQLTSAINAASFNGRGGKGCVVVFASGNDNLSTVSYPALLESVTAVGAISYNGKRKSPSTPDGENWGSNYGSALDVVAPGVLISTIDRQNDLGYNPDISIHTRNGGNILTSDYTNQDYTVWFNGTSAAAPFVSGIAALILSNYPNLTSNQVQGIIKQTSNLGTYSATSYYNGKGWNSEVGCGRVNAYEALLEAHRQTPIPAIDFKLINNSSQDLVHMYICLTGYIGGSRTILIDQDPGGAFARGTLEGYPSYPGQNISAAPGTAITNLELELYFSSSGSQNVQVITYIDNSSYNDVYTNTNFYRGNTVFLSLPNSSVPSGSRRLLNIVVNNR